MRRRSVKTYHSVTFGGWKHRATRAWSPGLSCSKVISPELVSEGAFFQAHSWLPHQMLCSGLVALQTLTLSEVMLLSVKKGTVRRKTNQGEQGENRQKGATFARNVPDFVQISCRAPHDK